MSEDPAFVWNAGQQRVRRVTRSRPNPLVEQQTKTPPDLSSDHATHGEDPGPLELQSTEAVLVPVDEWSRILSQLGNLHEAGQQLAAARERAAKAETESTFLRERLRDARDRGDRLQAEIDMTPDPEPEPLPGFSEWFVRRWLEKRKTGRD